MSSQDPKPDLRTQAMLLAFGLTGGDTYGSEETEFAGGIPIEEIVAAEQAAAALALSVAPAEPPPGLKSRLMERVAQDHDDHPAGLGSLRKDEGQWRRSDTPGVSFKVLYRDKKANLITQLVRMEPGAHYPAHIHAADEQCYIIQGDLRHNGHVFTAGDFTWAEGDTVDPELHTVEGNLLLIIGSPDTKIVTA